MTTILETVQAATQAALIPPELTSLRPRRTVVSKEDIPAPIIAGFLIVLALAGSAWAGYHTYKDLSARAILRTDGQLTSGEVTEIVKSSASYKFSVDGQSFTGDAFVPKPIRNTFVRHDTIPVRYLPSNPVINHPAAWEEPTGFAFLPFALPAIPAIWVPMLLVSSRRTRQVVAMGIPAIAVVTSFSKGSKGVIFVNYEFQTAEGRPVKGINSDFSPCRVGQSICILYLEQNPKRNLPYPSTHFTVIP